MTVNKKSKARRKRINRAARSQHGLDALVHPRSAGIDVGAEEFVVAVAPACCPGETCVRTFSTFTSGIAEVVAWLLACGITTVAMESTGNYWINLYAALEAAGIEACLTDARELKGVPGRKTDVCDAQWIQQLHSAGLLKKCHRPPQAVQDIRYLMRHRNDMVAQAASHIQHQQKALTEMNIKIQHVFSDIDGKSAQAIISAMLAGEHEPAALARLRDPNCRSKERDIIEALNGDYRAEILFVLRQEQAHWQQLRRSIAACDEQIARLISQVPSPRSAAAPAASENVPADVLPAPVKPQQHRRGKNSVDMDIFAEAYRFYQVDLSTIDGIGANVLTTMMSELGNRDAILADFKNADTWCSWLGLCPGNKISGGKRLGSKTRKVDNALSRILRVAAMALGHSKGRLGEYCCRMKGRLGKAEGITATAHKLARIIYGMLQSQRPYDETAAFKSTPARMLRRMKNLQKSAAALGLKLVADASAKLEATTQSLSETLSLLQNATIPAPPASMDAQLI